LRLYEEYRKVTQSFKKIKSTVIAALRNGTYQHEVRDNVDIKNLLMTGQVSAGDVDRILSNCNSKQLTTSPHHADNSIDVHVVKKGSWYIKFYFLDPNTVFISVHE